MTPARAPAVKDVVGQIGAGFMISEQMRAAVKALGTRGWDLYMVGRGGVLGDVDPAVVTATLWFFPHEFVAARWSAGRGVLDPASACARFTDVCHEWARVRLAAFEPAEAERLAALLETVARAASPVGAPLFAGWRAVPLPDDARARATQLCHVLREHRGAMHGIATTACGVPPLAAVLLTGGADNGRFFGWPEPYPPVDSYAEARKRAEQLTDELVEPAWQVLADAEFDECRALLGAARGAAFPPS